MGNEYIYFFLGGGGGGGGGRYTSNWFQPEHEVKLIELLMCIFVYVLGSDLILSWILHLEEIQFCQVVYC